MSVGTSAYVADSKEAAIRECGPYLLHFNRTTFSHGNFTETAMQRETDYSSQSSTDYVRAENLRTPEEVAAKIVRLAEHTGAGTVQVNFNRGAMPQEMFVEQIRRFGRDVLPILQAHQITHVPGADHVSHRVPA